MEEEREGEEEEEEEKGKEQGSHQGPSPTLGSLQWELLRCASSARPAPALKLWQH